MICDIFASVVLFCCCSSLKNKIIAIKYAGRKATCVKETSFIRTTSLALYKLDPVDYQKGNACLKNIPIQFFSLNTFCKIRKVNSVIRKSSRTITLFLIFSLSCLELTNQRNE